MILKFNAQSARGAALYSAEYPNLRPPYGIGDKLEGPNVHFVKDHGVYIMAHVNGDLTTDDEWERRKSVTYAEGYNPERMDHDDCWDACHRLSPDDFCEAIPTDMILSAPVHADGNIYIRVTQTQFAIMGPKSN
jgi:hypothetical protein